MILARSRAHWPFACVLLANCARTEVWLEPPLDESGGASGSNASAGDASAGHTSSSGANAGGATGGGGSALPKTCADVSCDARESCNPQTFGCECLPGFVRANATSACVPSSLPACDVPLAPVISVIDDAETLHFTVDGELKIETALQPASASPSAAVFSAQANVPLASQRGLTRVLVRVNDPSCTPTTFEAVYDVREACAPAEHAPTTTAISKTDPLIVGWATGVQSYRVGPGVNQLMFTDPNAALGRAEGISSAVVSLGDAGEISLSFTKPISNGAGWDFAVFENAFNDSFLELAFIEVSSDGSHFLRFDSAFLGQGPAAPSYSGDAKNLCGIAGSYAAGFGTPFDLGALRNQPLARNGTVDLNAIRYVRVVDIVGDGKTIDSFGRPIFDPNPSAPTAGFDLDAIAVLHSTE